MFLKQPHLMLRRVAPDVVRQSRTRRTVIVITIPRQLLAIVSTSVYRTLAQERLDILPAIPDQAANPEEPRPSVLLPRSPERRDLQGVLGIDLGFGEIVFR